MSSPKVSFVLPAYNAAAFLPHAIESCRKQTYLNTEIVVVDDGSTDSTPKLMEHYTTDKRIVYLRMVRNVGRSEARNFGNKHASGEYICVLDADDIAAPDRAKLTAAKLKSVDFVHGSCDYMDILGHKIGEHVAEVFNKDKAIKEGLNRMVHSTCAYRKSLADKVQYPGGKLSELGLDDWAFQVQVAMNGYKIDFIPQSVGAYRHLETGISKTRDQVKVIAAKNEFLEMLGVPA